MVKSGEGFTSKVPMAEKRRLTISLDEPDYVEIQNLAAAEDRSLAWIVSQAVKKYLEVCRDRPVGTRLPQETQTRLF
jgi:hypothetical protein